MLRHAIGKSQATVVNAPPRTGEDAAALLPGCRSFADVQESVAKYLNIETGEDFNGYEIPGQSGQNRGHPADIARCSRPCCHRG